MNTDGKINLVEKLSLFSDHWSPRLVESFNDVEVKLVKFQGEYVWHNHQDTDEVFFVLEGEFEMHYRDRLEKLQKHDLVVIPAGVDHKPVASEECSAMVLEKAGTVSTGNAEETDEIKASSGKWI